MVKILKHKIIWVISLVLITLILLISLFIKYDHIINDFTKYEENGYDPYDILYITEEDNSKIELPKTIKIKNALGITRNIKVNWECSEDVKVKEGNSYTYTAKLDEDYSFSETLQERYDNGSVILPYIEVYVLSKGDLVEERSDYLFSDIVDTWKDKDDDTLNEYFANNSDTEIYRFYETIGQEEWEDLLKRDTMLNNTTYTSISNVDNIEEYINEEGIDLDKVDITPDGDSYLAELPYSTWIENGMGVSKDNSVVGSSGSISSDIGYRTKTFSTTSGYFNAVFLHSRSGYKVTHKVTVTLSSKSVKRPEITVSHTATVNNAGSMDAGYTVNFTKTNVSFTRNYQYLRRAATANKDYAYQDADGNYTTKTVNGTKKYMTDAYLIADLAVSVKRPAFLRQFTYSTNGTTFSSDRLHFDTFTWYNDGTDSRDKKVYPAAKTDSLKMSVGINNLGIKDVGTIDEAGHSTVTLTYAHPTLVVNYNVNGATVGNSDYKATNNILYTVSSGEKTSLTFVYNFPYKNGLLNASTPKLAKTGYHFTGWGSKASGGTIFDQDDVGLLPNEISAVATAGSEFASRTATVYAQWKANTYTVAYDGNGATSGSTASSSHTYDTAKALTSNGFSRTGYKFSGWNTKADGSGTSYANNASVKNLTSTNGGTVTLYAQWVLNGGSIYYYPNGLANNGKTVTGTAVDEYPLLTSGDYVGASSRTQTYNYASTAYDLVNVGNAFKPPTGYHNPDGAKAWRLNSPSATTYLNQGTQDMSSYAVTHGTVLKLYPNWVANTYTVKYDGNGATSGSTANSSHTYDVAKNLTSNGFVKQGCSFVGWNTKADGTGTNYTNGKSVKNLTSTNGGSVTLYAQWEVRSNLGINFGFSL